MGSDDVNEDVIALTCKGCYTAMHWKAITLSGRVVHRRIKGVKIITQNWCKNMKNIEIWK